MLRATLTATAILAAATASAQGRGSMDVRLGGEDRTFEILEEESAVEPAGSAGVRTITLVAVPDADPSSSEAEGSTRLTLVFSVEGLGSDASTSASEPRIELVAQDGREYRLGEDMTSTVTLTSFTEIGAAFVLTGEFSSELAPEDGKDEILGASGSFQATFEGG